MSRPTDLRRAPEEAAEATAARPDRGDRPEGASRARPESREALLDRQSRLPPGHPSAPGYADGRPEPDVAGPGPERGEGYASWRTAVPRLRDAWQRHLARWPHDASGADGHGEQRPATSRGLDAAADRRLAQACETVAEAEKRITPAMRGIEAQDKDRHLAGLNHCLKGTERISEKADAYMEEIPNLTPGEAVALVPDGVRYTFQYREDSYADGVRADVTRLQAAGGELIKVRNYWTDPEYKGINSRWRDGVTGQRFEVQFHTAASAEAKEVTHGAYERLRTGAITDAEELELEVFQREVTALVPVPPGAADISDYP